MKYLIIGLGNMGVEYERTRHNIGFDVLDEIARQENVQFKADQLGDIAMFRHRGRTVYLLKPSTYMNLSGKAVRYWVQKLKINQNHWLTVVDEFQFEMGVIKLQKKGSSGGHNGLKSVENLMQSSSYPRLRIGIGHNFYRGQQVDYVLGKWTDEEWMDMQSVIESACDAIRSFVAIGLDRTMNQFNKKNSVE
ncbi:MAG: aminoacyl-tRNA hydrolase [Saprospiraceae bacterium]|nr:aminoacyl-tRNA hydrolase [Saprospiraceae bacterium]